MNIGTIRRLHRCKGRLTSPGSVALAAMLRVQHAALHRKDGLCEEAHWWPSTLDLLGLPTSLIETSLLMSHGRLICPE
jgi:hypothetical protein